MLGDVFNIAVGIALIVLSFFTKKNSDKTDFFSKHGKAFLRVGGGVMILFGILKFG